MYATKKTTLIKTIRTYRLQWTAHVFPRWIHAASISVITVRLVWTVLIRVIRHHRHRRDHLHLIGGQMPTERQTTVDAVTSACFRIASTSGRTAVTAITTTYSLQDSRVQWPLCFETNATITT